MRLLLYQPTHYPCGKPDGGGEAGLFATALFYLSWLGVWKLCELLWALRVFMESHVTIH